MPGQRDRRPSAVCERSEVQQKSGIPESRTILLFRTIESPMVMCQHYSDEARTGKYNLTRKVGSATFAGEVKDITLLATALSRLRGAAKFQETEKMGLTKMIPKFPQGQMRTQQGKTLPSAIPPPPISLSKHAVSRVTEPLMEWPSLHSASRVHRSTLPQS